MNTHLAWIRLIAAAAIAAVGLNGNVAQAQYAPYAAQPNGYGAQPYGTQPYGAQPYPTATPYGTQPVAPYGAPQSQAYTPAPQTPYMAARSNPYPTPQYQQPTSQPAYPTLAQQSNGQTALGSSGTLPTPAQAMGGEGMNGQTSYDQSYGGNGNQDGSSPYPTTGNYYGASGCANGSCGGYGDYSNGCGTDYGVSGYFDQSCGGTQWFGGVYALYMERDNPSYRRLSVGMNTPPAAGYPYYPPSSTTVLSTDDIDHDYREGVEIRFGSTFTIGSACDSGCDPYGYGYGGGGYGGGCGTCSCPQTYAWEFGWWAIDGDIASASYINANPSGTFRQYGTVNYAGLRYDGGSGDRTVNQYYDYQMPVNDPGTYVWPDGSADDTRVHAQRVRTNFRASNLELNIFRLPMIGGPVCSSSGCGGCDTCETSCGSPFSLTGLCGIRYFRVDDDFESATEWGTDAGGAYGNYDGWYNGANELFHDIQVENHLVGFQLGANMCYNVSCKSNLFWDTNFGLYNNHINHYQRMYNPFSGNYAEFSQENRNFVVQSDKNDIAFLGEMRLGGTYDFSCHCRGVLAYRAVAISGLALSTDQIGDEYSNWGDTARIDSDGSIIIHGVQVGVECRY